MSDIDVYGVPMPDLPDGYTASEVLVLVKAHNFDNDNPTMFFELRSHGLSKQEALGMIVTAGDSLRDILRNPHVFDVNPDPHDL